MKKWLPFCFFLPLPLFSAVNDNGDFQIWNKDALSIRLSQQSSLSGDIEFRYGDNARKLFYKHFHGVINWSPNAYITLSPGFRTVLHRLHKKWVRENDPLFILTLFFLRSRQVIISDRNWVQFRNLPKELGGKNRVLYRNQFQLLLPWQAGRFRISPHISDEIFWQEARGIFENRALFGLLMPRNQRAYFDTFYQYRNHKNLKDKWTHQHVLGLNALFYF